MLEANTKLDQPTLDVLRTANRQIMTQDGAIARLPHPKRLSERVAESLLGLALPMSRYPDMCLRDAAVLDTILS